MSVYDLVVIGGGPGGYDAAIIAAQHGLSVLLIEKESLGGACLNRGCIPTKSLLWDIKLFEQARRSEVLTGAEGLSLDLTRMVERKNRVVRTLVEGLAKIMVSQSVEVASGRGELMEPGLVKVSGRKGKSRRVRARNVILATGSKPAVPGFIPVDGRLIQTTDEALNPASVPGRLAIIGGGVIGVEFAAIYQALGSEVTILEMLPDIIATEDEEIRRAVRVLMEQRGIAIHLGAKVRESAPIKNKVRIVFQDKAGGDQRLEADRVLVATGRAPVTDGLDAKALGLAMDGPFLKVNARLETNLEGVFAIGDLVGGMMLAHKATKEAEVVVTNITGGNEEFKPDYLPRCIWSVAEVAAVGLTEKEARERGRSVKVGRFTYPNAPEAQVRGEINGWVKIVGDAETGEILGIHMLGEHVTDLIGEPPLAMTTESTVEDLAEVVKPHPTLSETVKEAALDWNNLSIHAIKKAS